MHRISKIFPCREYFAQELDAGGPVSIFILILAAIPINITARSFWPRGDRMCQISKFFSWRAYFAPELDTCGPESFFLEFFLSIWPPQTEKFHSIFLTGVLPESGIHFNVRQIGQISKIFPWREYFAQELDASGPKSIFILILVAVPPKITVQSFWLRATKWVKFSKYFTSELDALQNFLLILTAHGQKFGFGLFGQDATKWV